MIQQHVPARLRLSVKLAYGLGSAAASVMESAFGIFLLFFYQQVIGLDPGLCGLALFLSLCVDAVVDPAIGVWSDGLRTRMGRRHPLMYGAIVPVAIGLYAVFSPPAGASDRVAFLWLLGFATATRVALSLFVIPYLALVPELTTSVAERAALNNVSNVSGWMFALLNTLAGYLLFLPATPEHPQGLHDPAGYPRLAIFGASVMAIGMTSCAFGTQRVALAAQPDEDRMPAVGLRQLPRAIVVTMQSASYRAALFAGLCGSVAFGMNENMNNYVNTFYWGLTPRDVSGFIGVIFVAVLVVMVSARPLIYRLGNRGVAVAAAVLRSAPMPLLIALRSMGLLPSSGAALFAALALGVFVMYGATLLSGTAIAMMMADVTDEHELRTGSRQEGLLFSANMFISKAVAGLGTLAAGAVLQISHFPEHARPGEVDPGVVQDLGHTVAFALLFFGAAMIVFLLRYRLDLLAHARVVHLVTIRRHAAQLAKGPAKVYRDFAELITWDRHLGNAGDAPVASHRDAVARPSARSESERSNDGVLEVSPASLQAAEDDSFDALLRQAARVSEPAPRGRSRIQAGATLAGGRLSVLRRIGEGGMGVVYEALDAQRKTRVALKTLARIDATGVYRLKNEFRALAHLRHENLVVLHELFSVDESWFFTMDLVEGERFNRWVRPGRDAAHNAPDHARLRAALPQLVAAIGAVHAAGKLHRDLKPSNVLVTAEGRVVVLDFGLSVDPGLGGVGQTVADESVSGTPGYMAPEQAQGLAASAASDFYALGAMLFEALTGRLPFEGRAGEIIAAKQTRAAPAASSLASDVPADLEALCTGLLARDPDARRDAITQCMQLAAGSSGAGRRPASGATRASDPATASSQLLGRDDELAALRNAFEATLTGNTVVLFVAGESGMGKSALCTAFSEELRQSGRATVLAGRCHERENVPYKGFDAVVDELSRHLRKLSGQEAAALLPREAYALARIFPVLDRVPVVADAPKKHVPDPQDLKQRAFGAFGELIGRMRDRGPLVLLIDDLQWLDQDSMRFMRALLVLREPAPVLVVCAHRSEGADKNELLQAVLQGAADNAALDVRQLALGPLPHSALVKLAGRLLPDGDARAAEAFAAEAHGSPFFAAELARAASLTADPTGLSLAQALQLHVASLPVEAQTLLSLLALAGEPLSQQAACEAANLTGGHAALDRLSAERLVRVSFDADGERRVECYHDKIREHMSSRLEPLRTRELALGLSRALLATPAVDPELLARMLELAGMVEQAAQHAALAAERAFAALAFGRAAMLYEHALAHGQFEPERLHALRVGRAEALGHAGMGVQAAEAFLTAAAGVSGEQALELTRKAGEQFLLCGEMERGRKLFAQVLRRAGIRFPRTLAGAILAVAWWRWRLKLRGLHYTPRSEHSAATLRKLELLRATTDCLIRSDHLRAADFSARWVLYALEAGHEVELARALAWERLIALRTGMPETIVDEVRLLCARLCERTRDPLATSWFFFTGGIERGMYRGDPAADADLERSARIIRAHPFPTSSYDLRWFALWHAMIAMRSGRVADALEISQAEHERVVACGDHTLVAPLASVALLAQLASDRPELAARLRDATAARFTGVPTTFAEESWLLHEYLPALYRGRAGEAWTREAVHRARYIWSFVGRLMHAGYLEGDASALAAEAARQAKSPALRRTYLRAAERLARRSWCLTKGAYPVAVLACLRGDREAAIIAVRAVLCSGVPLLWVQMYRRRLGELLGGDEGAALIAGADAVMRAGGVVDPVRLTAAMVPGIELFPRSA